MNENEHRALARDHWFRQSLGDCAVLVFPSLVLLGAALELRDSAFWLVLAALVVGALLGRALLRLEAAAYTAGKEKRR